MSKELLQFMMPSPLHLPSSIAIGGLGGEGSVHFPLARFQLIAAGLVGGKRSAPIPANACSHFEWGGEGVWNQFGSITPCGNAHHE